MPFTETQKSQFISLLQAKGWQLSDDTILSPGGGLWFSDAHLADWGPEHVHDLFTQRAVRIAKMQHDNWQRSARENEEAAWAAKEVMRHD